MTKRTWSNSKGRYEGIWTEAFEKIENEIVHHKKNLIEAIETYQIDELRQSAQNAFSFKIHKNIGLVSSPDQTPSERLVVKNGNYAIASVDNTFNSEITNSLAEIIDENREQIDYIVELGSGMGRQIFAIADSLIPYQKQKQIEYFACEFTDSGQEACRKLLKYSKEQKIHVEYFDYMNPDLSFLPRNKNYLFFTFHSIEQIPELPRAVIDEMLAVSDNCFCLHAEPVGWQYNDDLIEYRRETQRGAWKENKPFLTQKLTKLNKRLLNRYGLSLMKMSHKYGIELDRNDIDKPDKVSANAAKLSLERDYNANLVSLLKTIENDGLIKIDSEKVNIYGKKPFNPTTMIKWHKLNS